MVVFWTDGDERRAILASDYADAHSLLERVLRRFDGGSRHYASLRAKVGELAEPGVAITAVLGRHRVGLMRPYLAGVAGAEPYVVCREARGMLQASVICASLEDARSFARTASEAKGLSRAGWRAFEGERLLSPIERLFSRGHDGSVRLRSALEEALSTSLAHARAAAVEPPEVRVARGKPSLRARRTATPNSTRPSR